MVRKKEQRLVSVIIPCFNMGEFITDAVKSIISQTYQNFEIIIIDDGSDDERTLKELKNLVFLDNRIKIIHQGNKKLPGARNTGINISSGEYITCLDADDKFRKDFLEKTVRVFENDKQKKIGIVSSWIQCFGEHNQTWKININNKDMLLAKNYLVVSSLFRKDIWEQVGGYNEKMIDGYEDWDFWLSIIEQGYNYKIIQEPIFEYRIRKNSMLKDSLTKHDKIYSQIIENHIQLFRKKIKEVLIIKDSLIKEQKDYVEELLNLIKELKKNG